MNKTRFVIMLLAYFLITNMALAKKKTNFPSQVGIGSVDTFVAHGHTVYRFVPDDKKLRMVKFVSKHLGYGESLPENMETLLAKAFKDKLKVEISCQYKDHGEGKTAQARKIISLAFVKK